MNKSEFILALKDLPDDAELVFYSEDQHQVYPIMKPKPVIAFKEPIGINLDKVLGSKAMVVWCVTDDLRTGNEKEILVNELAHDELELSRQLYRLLGANKGFETSRYRVVYDPGDMGYFLEAK